MAQQVIRPTSDVGSKAFRVLDLLTPLNGTAAPVVNANFLGQKYIDTAAKAEYTAVAVGSANPADDWIKMATAV